MSTQVLSQQLVQILEAASQLVDVTDSAALLLVVSNDLIGHGFVAYLVLEQYW